MLTLPIKKKWFDMILSGEKKEEYRELKPYYKSRFSSIFQMYPYSKILSFYFPLILALIRQTYPTRNYSTS